MSLYLLQFAVTFIFLYVFVLLNMARHMQESTRSWKNRNFWGKLQALYILPTIYLTIYLTIVLMAAYNVLLWVQL